jgi:hypothetical protein
MIARYWKIAAIVLGTVAADILMHKLFAPSPKYNFPASIFVESGWFLPVVITMLLITFLALAVLFHTLQNKMAGTGLGKGFLFGFVFGVLFPLLGSAMSLLFGSPLWEEWQIGLVDGLSALLLGILLGRFTAMDSPSRKNRSLRLAVVSIGLVGGVYFAVQNLIYLLFPVLFPAIQTKPMETLVFIMSVGLWIGLMAWQFQDAMPSRPAAYQALWFTGIVYGIFSLLNALFAPVFVATPIVPLLLGTMSGLLSVFTAVWVSRSLLRQSAPRLHS